MSLALGGLAVAFPDDIDTPPDATVTDVAVIELPADPAEFDANLAEAMTSTERDELAEELLELVEGDARARQDWDKLAKKGQRMMGIAIDEAKQERAARDRDERDQYWTHTAVHPLLAEAITRFQAQAGPELFPPEGPAKGSVIPENATQELEEQAARMARLINWIATDECPEYGDQTDRLLFIVPLDGVAYTKVTHDEDRFIRRLLVRSRDVWLPWHVTTFGEATRVTHRMRWHPSRIKRLQKTGYLINIELSEGATDAEERGEAEIEADRTVGLDATTEGSTVRTDAPLEILEVYADYILDGPGLPDEEAPYVFTIARADRKLLAVRRNWRPSSPERRRRWELLTQWPFVLGDHPGPYAYGLPHLIGSLSETATVLLRAALDMAAKHAHPPGFIQSTLLNHPDFDKKPLSPGELRATPTTVEDLQRALYFLNPGDAGPLVNILQFIVEAGQRFASTTDINVGAGDNRAPVGTTLAMIEQGSRVYSSIHARLHRAQRRELRTIADLIGEYTPEDQPYPWPIKGGLMPIRPDFDGRVDVVPVSDPHVSSSAHRLAAAQALVQLAEQIPDLFDRYEVGMRMLIAMRISSPEKLLIRPEEAERRDAVSENMCFLFNRPVRAYFDQDHQAHLAVHQQWFMTLPPEGQNQLMGPFMAHMGEHLAYEYRTRIEGVIGQMTQSPPGALLPPPPSPKDEKDDELQQPPLAPEQERAVDAVAAQAAQMMQQSGMGGQPLTPEQQKAQAEQQKADAEAKKLELQARKQEADAQLKVASEARRAELEAQRQAADMQLRREQMQQDLQLRREEMALKQQQATEQAAREEQRMAADHGLQREKLDREDRLGREKLSMDYLGNLVAASGKTNGEAPSEEAGEMAKTGGPVTMLSNLITEPVIDVLQQQNEMMAASMQQMGAAIGEAIATAMAAALTQQTQQQMQAAERQTQALGEMAALLNAPKEVIRDADGKVTGVRPQQPGMN